MDPASWTVQGPQWWIVGGHNIKERALQKLYIPASSSSARSVGLRGPTAEGALFQTSAMLEPQGFEHL